MQAMLKDNLHCLLQVSLALIVQNDVQYSLTLEACFHIHKLKREHLSVLTDMLKV